MILLDVLEGWVVRTLVRVRSAKIGRISLMIPVTTSDDDGGDGDSGDGEPVRTLGGKPRKRLRREQRKARPKRVL